ncbi:hypothetical protein L9F63_010143, partial [Diploptera punctata]
VRLEKGDGGKSQNVSVSQDLPADNATSMARAKQSPALGDSIHSLASQLLGFARDSSDSSDSLVEEDVRTPPKLKSQIKHKQNSQQVKSTTQSHIESGGSHHKGVAVPVIIEEDDDIEETIEKISNTEPLSIPHVTYATTRKKPTTKITTPLPSTTMVSKPYYETTSSDGVSTWILLSGSSSTTPTIKRKTNKTPTTTYVKTTYSTPITSTSYYTTPGSTTTKRVVEHFDNGTRKYMSTTTQSPNHAQTIDFFKPARTRKPHPTRTTTTTTTTGVPETAISKRRPSNQPTKVVSRVTTIKPPVVTIIRAPDSSPQEDTLISSENSIEVSTTEVSAETNTSETNQTSGNKKRKKNKNRRRRPSKKPGSSENAESKIDDTNAASNDKVSLKERPLSTRIYNYLAREVMPSVGVGLIGLVVTAGLAGLFMYPFGGGVTRRTYEVPGYHHHIPASSSYYHGDMEGGQSEEEVFGKLLEGMNDKGEFTYSGIGEETSGYAGVSGMDNEFSNQKNVGYNTGNSRVENQNIRYGNGNSNAYRYDTGSNKNGSMMYSQHQTGNNYEYPAITTRSSEIINSKESQEGVHSEYGESYFKPQYSSFQPQIGDMYKKLAVVGSQNYGNVQLDNKPGTVHEAVDISTQNNYKTIQNPENRGQHYRTVYDSKQQYIDVIGTQPRSSTNSGGTSVITPTDSQNTRKIVTDDVKFKPISSHKHTEGEIKEKQVANDRTLEVDSDSEESEWDNVRYRGYSDIASKIHSGLVQHGPRSLRNRRNVNGVSKNKNDMISTKSSNLNGISLLENKNSDMKDNEIDSDVKSNEKKENIKDISSHSKGVSESPDNTTSLNKAEGTVAGITEKRKENVSNTEEESTTYIENNDLITGTDVKIDVSTEDEFPTTTYSSADGSEENKTEKIITPSVIIRNNETSIHISKNKTVVKNKVQDNQFSLLGLFRRIARFKLQMGLNLLKSTSQAFTNYIERVQTRIDKDYYRESNRSFNDKRYKRAVQKSEVNGKKLENMLRNRSKKEHISIFKTIQKAVMNH